jgi:hypothetical protein
MLNITYMAHFGKRDFCLRQDGLLTALGNAREKRQREKQCQMETDFTFPDSGCSARWIYVQLTLARLV